MSNTIAAVINRAYHPSRLCFGIRDIYIYYDRKTRRLISTDKCVKSDRKLLVHHATNRTTPQEAGKEIVAKLKAEFGQ